MIRNYLLGILICLLKYSIGLSQPGELKIVNNTFNPRVEKLFDSYSLKIGVSSPVYNGHEYYHDDNSTGGNPFFMDMNLHDGLVKKTLENLELEILALGQKIEDNKLAVEQTYVDLEKINKMMELYREKLKKN